MNPVILFMILRMRSPCHRREFRHGACDAKAFAEAGAAVVLVDINESALRAAIGGLTSARHRARQLPQSSYIKTSFRSMELLKSRW
jgi:hypothetical protein